MPHKMFVSFRCWPHRESVDTKLECNFHFAQTQNMPSSATTITAGQFYPKSHGKLTPFISDVFVKWRDKTRPRASFSIFFFFLLFVNEFSTKYNWKKNTIKQLVFCANCATRSIDDGQIAIFWTDRQDGEQWFVSEATTVAIILINNNK